MGKRKRLRSIVVAAAIAVSALGLSAPASAAPSDCNLKHLCVYYDAYYAGKVYHFKDSNSSWGPWVIEDDDSSWFNNGTSGMGVRVYHNRSYGGGSQCWSKGRGERISLYHQDKGSSNLWVGSC